jgi:hypothetical protein
MEVPQAYSWIITNIEIVNIRKETVVRFCPIIGMGDRGKSEKIN